LTLCGVGSNAQTTESNVHDIIKQIDSRTVILLFLRFGVSKPSSITSFSPHGSFPAQKHARSRFGTTRQQREVLPSILLMGRVILLNRPSRQLLGECATVPLGFMVGRRNRWLIRFHILRSQNFHFGVARERMIVAVIFT
jgi:hypothetical protein